MTYEIHLEKPIPKYAKAGLDIKGEKKSDNGEFVSTIKFANEIENDEFRELVDAILDINGSEELA